MSALSTGLRRPGIIVLLLAVLLIPESTHSAPVFDHDTTQVAEYDGGAGGCYYNFQRYQEGDRIVTNEPCLNCTCHNRMLMCYLRVCPFTKAIGQDCTVEKRPDQCCPVITCPEVPVQLLTSTTSAPSTSGSTEVGFHDNYGCNVDDRFYADGAQLPIDRQNPCELCYCIRNRTTCVMQECTLRVAGCRPIYQPGVCCPVRYNCEYDEELGTTVGSTTGLIMTTTIAPGASPQCYYEGKTYEDGELIYSTQPCQHCYCFRGDIACAVQDCGTPMKTHGKNCTALPPPEGECCPTTYQCDDDGQGGLVTVKDTEKQDVPKSEDTYTPNEVTEAGEAGEAGESQHPAEDTSTSFPIIDNIATEVHETKEENTQTPIDIVPSTEKASEVALPENIIPLEENVVPEIEGSKKTDVPEIHVTEVPSIISEAGEEPKTTEIPQISEEEKTKIIITTERSEELSTKSIEEDTQKITELPITEESSQASSTEEALQTEEEKTTEKSVIIEEQTEETSTKNALEIAQQTESPIAQEIHTVSSEPELQQNEKEAATPSHEATSTEITLNEEIPIQETINEVELPKVIEEETEQTETQSTEKIIEEKTTIKPLEHEEQATTQIVKNELPTETSEPEQETNVVQQSTEGQPDESSTSELELATKAAEIETARPSESTELPQISSTVQQHSLEEDEKKVEMIKPEEETTEGKLPTLGPKKEDVVPPEDITISEEPNVTKVQGEEEETVPSIPEQGLTGIPIPERVPELKAEDKDSVPEIQVTEGYVDMKGPEMHIPESLVTEAPKNVPSTYLPPTHEVTTTTEQEKLLPVTEESITKMHQLEENEPTVSAIPINHEEATTVGIASSIVPASEYSSTSESIPITKLQDQNDLEEEPKQPEKSEEHVTEIMHPELQSTEEISTDEELPTKGLTIKESGESSSEEISSEEHDVLPPKKDQITTEKTEQNVTLDESSTETISEISTISTNEEQSTKIPTVEETHTEENEKETSKIDVVEASTQGTISEEKSVETSTTPAEIPTTNEPTFDKEADQEQSTITLEEGEAAVTSTAEEGTEKAETEIPTKGQSSEAPQLGEEKVVTESIIPSEMPTKEIETQPTEEIPTEEYVTKPHFINTSESSVPEEQPEQTTISESASSEASPTVEIQTTISTIKEDKPLMAETQTEALLIEHTESSITDQPTEITQEIQKEEIPTDTTKTEEQNTEKAIIEEQPTEKSTIEEQLPEEQITQSSTNIQLPTEASIMERKEDEIPGKEVSTEKESEEQEIQKPSLEEEKATDLGIEEGKPTETPSKETVTNEIVTEQIFVDSSTSEGETSEKSETEQATELPTLHQISTESIKEVTEIPTVVAHPSTGSPNEEDKFTEKPIAKETQTEVSIQEEISTDKTLLQSSESTVQTEGSSLSTTESGPEKPIEEKILEEPANKITSTEESVIESSTKIEIPSEASTEITKIEEVTHSDIEMSSEQGPITQQEIEIHSTESTHLETKPSDEKEHTQPEPVIPDMSVTEKEHREPEISKDTETEIPIQELETTLAPTEEEVTILTSTPESTLTAETFTPTKEEIPVSMSTSEPALITETTSPKTIEQSTEQEIATTSQILPIDKIIPEQPMISHPSEGIPGEGNCLVDGQSYSNNSAIPPANPCQLSCHCLSSIIQCELVQCPPPPNHLSNCMPVHTGKDSCCPIYTCDSTSTIELESDNHMIEHHTPKYEEEKTQQTVQPIVPEIPMQESTEPSELVKEHSTISSETTAPIIPSQEHTVPSISSTEKEIPTIITETTIKSSESTSEEPTDIKEFTPDKTQDHFISSVPSSQEETSSQPSTEQPISISTSVISEKTEDVTQQEEQTTFSTSSENPIPNLTEEELSKPVTDEKHITPISTNITEEEQSIDENKIIPTSEVSQTESSILIEEHKNVDEEEIPGQGTIKPIIDGQETNEPATASEQPVTNIIEEKETPSPTTPEGHTITVEGPVKGSEVVEESQKPIKTSEEVSTSPVEFTSGQASEEKTSTVPEKEQKENVPSLEEQPVTPEEVTIQSEIHTDQPNEPEKQETTESAIEISTSVHDEKTSATYEPVLIEHETQNPIKSETSPAIELETSTEISIEIGNTIQKEQTNVPVESVSTEASESEHVEGTTIKTAADIEEKPETTVTNEPHVEGSIEMDTKEATLGIEEQTKETTSSPVSLEEENTVQVTTESAQELILTEEQTSLPGESITAQPESTEEPSAHETASPSTANTSESNITGETKITQPSLEEQSESTISTESQTLKPSFEQEQTTAEEYPIKSVTTQESVTEQATVSLVNEISPLVEEQPAERTTLKEEIVEQSTPETEITESVTEKELTTVTEQRPDVSEEQSIEKHTSAPISENEVSTESMENKIPEEEKEITEQTLTPIEVETQKPTVSTNDQSTISTIYKSEESATTISSIEFSTSTSPIEVQSTSVKSIEEEKVIASKEPSETILPNLEVSPPVESTEATEAVTTEKVQTEERKPEDIGTIEQQPIEPVISEETTIFVTPEAPTAQPPTIEEQSSSEENVEFTRQTESSISEAEIIKQTTEPTTSEKISPEEISTKIAETVTEEPAEKVSILPTEISSTELPEGVPVEETKEQEEQVKESEVESPVQISTEKEEFEIPKTTESILIKGEEKEVVRTEQPKDEDQSTSIPSSTEATQSTDAPILIEETSPDDEVVVTKLQPTESSTISEEQENTSQENTPQENLPTESIEVGTIAVQEQSTTTEHVPEAPVTKINEQSQSQPEETSTKSELPEELPSSTFAPTVAVTYNEEGNLTASSITPEVHEPEIIVTSTKPEEAHETTESLPEKHVIKLQPIPAKVPITETSEATIGDSSKEDDEGVQQNVNIAEIEPSLQLPEKEEPIEGQFEEHLQPINHTVETTEQPLKTDLYEHPSTSTAMPQSGFEYPEQSVSGEDNPHFPMQGGSYLNPDEDYDEDDQAIYGPGTCRHRGKVYVSAQQIPRDDPCDFCFCFRSDIICLQQSCPPPIPGCHEEPISGFCCPRYECPVSMATTLNITTTTTTTTTTLPPHFLAHAYKGAARRSGCQIRGQAYRVGEVIKSASGPCLHCTCGGDGNMKCDPRICSPEPMLRQMIAAATARRRR